VPTDVFYDELKFFGLAAQLSAECACDESLLVIALRDQLDDLEREFKRSTGMSDSARVQYRREKRRVRARFEGLRYLIDAANDNDDDDENYADEEDIRNGLIPANRAQKWLWLVMERPNASLLGKLVAFVCLVTVITSVVIMCAETMVSWGKFNVTSGL
jgi:hypothetical protein